MRHSAWLACAALGLASPPAHADDFRLWIRSFIPNVHPTNAGYVQPVPGQPGKTMIPGPGIPYVSSGPLPWVGSCYNTSNRGFSADKAAEAKITVAISFSTTLTGVERVVIEPPVFTPTSQYDCQSGQVTCSKTTAATTRTSQPVMAGRIVTFEMEAEGSNPCIPAPNAVTPSIKFRGKITIDRFAHTVKFEGTTARFPSYEAYFSVNKQAPVPLFQLPPADNTTVWSLAFNRDVNKTSAYSSIEGIWESTTPNDRWRLEIADNKCRWTERGSSGAVLRRDAGVSDLGNGSYRIARSNDRETLSFLGFSPAIQADILARSPQPSFMTLTPAATGLVGAWNGLEVIKDNQARFRELRQPGTIPSKPYGFAIGS